MIVVLVSVVWRGCLQLCGDWRLIAELVFWLFFFKQKTAYDVRISDWNSDVCSSDLRCYQVFHRGRDIPPSVDRFDALRSSILDIATDTGRNPEPDAAEILALIDDLSPPDQIGSASCRERVCQYV